MTAAPVPIVGWPGSPINPIATFDPVACGWHDIHGAYTKGRLVQLLTILCQVLLAGLSLAGSLTAAPPPRDLKWRQLEGVIAGQSVVVELKDGSTVKGRPMSVEPAALAVEITSNSHRIYKKGQAVIPRGEIAGLRVAGSSGAKTGFLIGLIGVPVGGAIAAHGRKCRDYILTAVCEYPIGSGQKAAAATVIIGAPVAGYVIGRLLGRQEFRIRILPD